MLPATSVQPHNLGVAFELPHAAGLTALLKACFTEPGPARLTLSCWLCSFNVNELIAVQELHNKVAEAGGQPIVVFNGELDRIRWVLAK